MIPTVLTNVTISPKKQVLKHITISSSVFVAAAPSFIVRWSCFFRTGTYCRYTQSSLLASIFPPLFAEKNSSLLAIVLICIHGNRNAFTFGDMKIKTLMLMNILISKFNVVDNLLISAY